MVRTKQKDRKTNKAAGNHKNTTVPVAGQPQESAESAESTEGTLSKRAAKKQRRAATVASRDYVEELGTYLKQWNIRAQGGQWKFNKSIQNWALDNWQDAEKVNEEVFKTLCEYMDTIVGGARDRLIALVVKILSAEKGADGSKEYERAYLLKQYISE